MKEIEVSRSMKAFCDDELYDFLNQYTWYALEGRNTYYAQMFIPNSQGKKSSILMHHLIQGRPLKPFVSEHKNGNGLDNRKSNLTFLTIRDNAVNTLRRRNGQTASIYPGVQKLGSKWNSRILIGGVHKCLGTYWTELEASEAYEKEKARI